MQFSINQELIDELAYIESLCAKTQELIEYMQPKMCSMVNIPIRVKFDTSFHQPMDEYKTMASICFGVMKINILNVKNFMGSCFYTNECISYLSFLIAHELSHSDQYVDHVAYNDGDSYHTWYVESSADYNALRFLVTHRKDIADILCMDEEQYGDILDYIHYRTVSDHYGFSNTKIDKISLIDKYRDIAVRKLASPVKDTFIEALSSPKSSISIYVYYYNEDTDNLLDEDDDIDLSKIDPYLVSRCIIKQNGEFKPLDYDIIDTVDCIDGFRAFMIDGMKYNWYSFIFFEGSMDNIRLSIIRRVQPHLRQEGFYIGVDDSY